jgi:hypothetical protein
MNQYDILLTGSAVQYCPAIPKTGLWDTRERLTDYLCAIRLWLEDPNVRSVIYCDAGGYQLPEEIISNDRFESLNINLIDLCVQKGRGAAECESIRYAMEKSRFLGNRFFKCTGRIYVTNFNEIVRATQPEGQFLYLNKSDKLQGADTRFYGIDKTYYLESVLPLIEKMHDYSNEIVEKVFYHHIHQYCFFPIAHIMGRSAYFGHHYETYYPESLLNKTRRLLEKMEIPKSY